MMHVIMMHLIFYQLHSNSDNSNFPFSSWLIELSIGFNLVRRSHFHRKSTIWGDGRCAANVELSQALCADL